MPPSRKVPPYEQGQADRHRGAGRQRQGHPGQAAGPAPGQPGPAGAGGHLPGLRQRFQRPDQNVSGRAVRLKTGRCERLRGLQLFCGGPLCQLQDRLGPLLRGGRRGYCRPLHHLQRGAPVLQAPAGAVGGIFALAVRLRVPSAGPARTGQRHLPAGGPGGQPAADDRPLPR